MKILSLQAENFMRLRSVFLRPDGSVFVVGGKNGAGKTSCLEAVASVLGGAALCPAVPIRRGQDHAEVTADLGELIVTRRWNADGSGSLHVKSPEGAHYRTPQAVLDRLINGISFDPLAFTRAKPADQRDTLQTLVGLDFTALDADRKDLFDLRTVTNRDVTTIRGSYARMPEVDAPDEPVSVTALLSEQEKRLTLQKTIDEAGRAATAAAQKRERAEQEQHRAQESVTHLEQQLAAAREFLTRADGTVTTAKAAEVRAVDAWHAMEPPDLQSIRAQLRDAEGINAKVRAKKARAAEAQKLAAKEAESKALTEKIEALDKLKSEKLASARFPVEGLGFTEGGVTFNGLPLEQSSSAEQLRISVAIGAALNSKLRVILVRDGSLLDEDSLRLLAETAEKLDLQVWLERVSEGGEGGVLIEDGAVVGADQPVLPGMDGTKTEATGA